MKLTYILKEKDNGNKVQTTDSDPVIIKNIKNSKATQLFKMKLTNDPKKGDWIINVFYRETLQNHQSQLIPINTEIKFYVE